MNNIHDLHSLGCFFFLSFFFGAGEKKLKKKFCFLDETFNFFS